MPVIVTWLLCSVSFGRLVPITRLPLSLVLLLPFLIDSGQTDHR